MFFDDGLNPKFAFHSPILAAELDAPGTLSPARFAAHVTRAIDAWCAGTADTHVIRDTRVEIVDPIGSATTMRIDVWVERLDDSSCVYGFFCSSVDGRIAFARGDRTILKPGKSWTPVFRARNATLLKDLPRYA